jgi:hypothetical protein
MLYTGVLLALAFGLFTWFVTMAGILAGPIGALVAFWGPPAVGLLIYKDIKDRPY